MVLRLRVMPKHTSEKESKEFFGVVRAGFSSPRKQLRNVLSKALKLSSDETEKLLESTGISPERRAETLSLVEWERLKTTLRRKPRVET